MTFYNKDDFKPLMFRNDVKEKYDELVRHYRFMNKCHHVNDFLFEVFDRALNELKVQGCRVRVVSQTDTHMTLKHNKFINLLNERNLYAQHWEDKIKFKIKIDLQKFNSLIKEVFKVRSREKITQYKQEICEILDLKQEQVGKYKFYIVHRRFRDSEDLTNIINKELSNDEKQRVSSLYEEIINHIEERKSISLLDLQDKIPLYCTEGERKSLTKQLNQSQEIFILEDNVYHISQIVNFDINEYFFKIKGSFTMSQLMKIQEEERSKVSNYVKDKFANPLEVEK